MFDAEKIRDRFPAFREKREGAPLIYFDNASTSQKPDCVIEAVASFYRSGCGNVHRGVHGLTSEATRVYEEARETVARFIGASDPSEIGDFVDVEADICNRCHIEGLPLELLEGQDRMRIFRPDEDSPRLLGITNPIYNEETCWTAACHAHPETQSVLGMLDVIMPLTEVDRNIRRSQIAVIWLAISAILILSLIVGFMVRWWIDRPVQELLTAMKHVSGGNLAYRVKVTRDDELGMLARSFNNMTDNLAQARLQLFQSDKLASLGRLAAGVAHEINNPLTGVMTFSHLLLKNAKDEATRKDLEIIVRETTRCKKIIKGILDFAREATEQRSENTEAAGESLGLYQTPEPTKQPTSVDRTRAGGLPRRHLIGSGSELSRRVVMVIRTGDLTPTQELSPTVEPYRYYWRSVTYDIYGGQGWYASHVQVLDYDAGEQIHSPTQLHRRLVRQEVEVVVEAEEHLLHMAGTLVAADQRYRVAWRPPGDIFAALTEASVYRVDSLVPVVGTEELRAAGSDYPDWVLERYLTLPDEMPERVLALGRDLTATEPTPYERALAIECYLRENYPYTLDVPQPPFKQDIADYFLFDLQKGYCDYYATAMTVLARAAGLPARLAIGYASGDYDAAEARYVVTEADAHAWTEIYFPEYGWIIFEPTGGYPPLERPTEVEPIIWPEPQEPLRPPPSPPGPLVRYWYLVLLGCGVAAALGLLIKAQLELLWLRTRPPAQVTTFLYRRLRRWGQRLDVTMHQGDTPYEFAEALVQCVEEIAGRRDRAGWLLPAGEEIHSLTEAYVQTWYTRQPPDVAGRDAALRTWRKLRWRLWLARLWGRRPTRLELTLTGGRVMEPPRKPRVLPHPYSGG